MMGYRGDMMGDGSSTMRNRSTVMSTDRAKGERIPRVYNDMVLGNRSDRKRNSVTKMQRNCIGQKAREISLMQIFFRDKKGQICRRGALCHCGMPWPKLKKCVRADMLRMLWTLCQVRKDGASRLADGFTIHADELRSRAHRLRPRKMAGEGRAREAVDIIRRHGEWGWECRGMRRNLPVRRDRGATCGGRW